MREEGSTTVNRSVRLLFEPSAPAVLPVADAHRCGLIRRTENKLYQLGAAS
jgi:hypothetical protein